MTLRLRIDRVVLEGLSLPPRQQQVMRAAMQRELARLLGGAAADMRTPAAVASIAAPAITTGAQSRPAQIGRDVARAVVAGIGRR